MKAKNLMNEQVRDLGKQGDAMPSLALSALMEWWERNL
jgi:hypothetical protein